LPLSPNIDFHPIASTRFVPVDINLLPRELFTDHGTLVLELVDGEGLKGADRSGKSDPYAVFELNGAKVFKSDTKKKWVRLPQALLGFRS
jgi:Ca2+-dependent lipid-binding protein